MAVRLCLGNVKVTEKERTIELKLEVKASWNMVMHECNRTSLLMVEKGIPPLGPSSSRTISAHNLDGFDLPYLRFREATNVRPLTSQDRTLTVNRARKGICSASYMVRYALVIACPMVFNNFPADEQICDINIQHDTEEGWSETTRHLVWEEENAIDLLPSFKHPEFDLEASKTKFKQHWSSTVPKVSGGLGLRLRLTRRLTAQLLQTYAPSGLLVVLSWSGFWLRGLGERLGLCCMLLLALCTQISQLRRILPPCAGLTGVDVWMFSCLLFVFAVLVVFTLSHNIKLKRRSGNVSETRDRRRQNE
ncbi:glycine receptor subunit alphaZ1 [Dermacentor silvarum]|uniref:glycine receptor subunit alphaZ1 n=1 Tax=Dermacentor silvarum TaxID=543639 RepID=UPI0021010841|nr:glycine receptor subunit alphaZ1 [Dermacentor silvarum]